MLKLTLYVNLWDFFLHIVYNWLCKHSLSPCSSEIHFFCPWSLYHDAINLDICWQTHPNLVFICCVFVCGEASGVSVCVYMYVYVCELNVVWCEGRLACNRVYVCVSVGGITCFCGFSMENYHYHHVKSAVWSLGNEREIKNENPPDNETFITPVFPNGVSNLELSLTVSTQPLILTPPEYHIFVWQFLWLTTENVALLLLFLWFYDSIAISLAYSSHRYEKYFIVCASRNRL